MVDIDNIYHDDHMVPVCKEADKNSYDNDVNIPWHKSELWVVEWDLELGV